MNLFTMLWEGFVYLFKGWIEIWMLGLLMLHICLVISFIIACVLGILVTTVNWLHL